MEDMKWTLEGAVKVRKNEIDVEKRVKMCPKNEGGMCRI